MKKLTAGTKNASAPVAREQLACLCSISSQYRKGIPVTLYRKGAVIDWSMRDVPRGTPKTTRGEVEDLSQKSARRLLFILNNTPKPFGAMVTLTFREIPTDVKQAFRVFWRTIRRMGMVDGFAVAWVMEFQARGAVHFHVLFELDMMTVTGYQSPKYAQPILRNGKTVVLIRGAFEDRIISAWTDAVGDYSEAFSAFQQGGICEQICSEDGAANYFASYLSKASQKTLPKEIRSGGRWWYATPQCTPIPTATARLVSWPYCIPFNNVFDKRELEEHLTDITPSDTLLNNPFIDAKFFGH